MLRQSHLAALGLDTTATSDAIKRRYRYLVSRWHPDRFANDPRMRPLAEATLKQINIAYAALREQVRPGRASAEPPPLPPVADARRSWPQRLTAMMMAAVKEARRPICCESGSARRPRTVAHRRPQAFQEILAEMGASANRLRTIRRAAAAGRRTSRRRRTARRSGGSGMRISAAASGPRGPGRVERIRSIRPIGSDDS